MRRPYNLLYIMLTSKCNMECPHCAMKCSPREGEHMSLDTFELALQWVPDTAARLLEGGARWNFCIGGGELTIHPRFRECMEIALDWCRQDNSVPDIITNGKHRKEALWLLELAKMHKIVLGLSLDKHHDRISQEVIDAFEAAANYVPSTFLELRRNNWAQAVGRWAETHDIDETKNTDCVGPYPVIRPNGDIHSCSCLDSPLRGNVHTHKPGDLELTVGCYKWLTSDRPSYEREFPAESEAGVQDALRRKHAMETPERPNIQPFLHDMPVKGKLEDIKWETKYRWQKFKEKVREVDRIKFEFEVDAVYDPAKLETLRQLGGAPALEAAE